MRPKKLPYLAKFALISFLSTLSSHTANALTYYWDNNADTAGFGTASGTWSGTGSLFTESPTGEVAPTGSVVTLAVDNVYFGANTVGNAIGSGTIVVDGNVTANSMYFELTPSGTLTFDAINGGKITTGNSRVESTETGTTVIFNADFVGATTQWFGAGSKTIYNGNYKNTGNSSVRAGHTVQFGSNSTIDLSGRNITFVSAEANGTIQYSSNNDGVITGAIGGSSTTNRIIKDGSATSTLALGSANTYLGEYIIDAGTLRFAVRGGLYNAVDTNWLASKIKVGNTGVLGLNVGGTNRFTVDDVATILTNLGGANGTSTTGFAAGSAIAIDTTNATGDQTLAALIADSTGDGGGSLGFIKLGTNNLILSNANTHSGNTTVKGGVLTLGNALAIQNSALDTTNSVAGAATAGLRISDGITSLTVGGLIGNKNFEATTSGVFSTATSNYSNITALTLNPGSGISNTYSGVITDGATGMTLTKTGLGTQILGGTNTYTGATTVSAGKLVVNGSISASPLTTVASGATIGGSGTVGALTISSGGFVTPGNSPGILNVNGNYIQAGTYTAEIDGLTAGTGHDQISVTGAVDVTGGSLTALFSGSYSAGALIFILLNDGTDSITGIYSGLAQGSTVTTYGGLNWNISYFADSEGNSFTGGNDIALQAVLIPEPKAALLGALGVLLLLRRRR